MIRYGEHHAVEIINLQSGEVIARWLCDDKAEQVDMGHNLRVALALFADQARAENDTLYATRGIGPILARCEYIKPGDGVDEDGPWSHTEKSKVIAAVMRSWKRHLGLFLNRSV
jgi:hypothetical protein